METLRPRLNLKYISVEYEGNLFVQHASVMLLLAGEVDEVKAGVWQPSPLRVSLYRRKMCLMACLHSDISFLCIFFFFT